MVATAVLGRAGGALRCCVECRATASGVGALLLTRHLRRRPLRPGERSRAKQAAAGKCPGPWSSGVERSPETFRPVSGFREVAADVGGNNGGEGATRLLA